MKFRKKPVVVEAVQYLEDSSDTVRAVLDFLNGAGGVRSGTNMKPHLFIPTLEGEMRAEPGDWIIRGVAGEFYPCKPDIFDATYERIAKDEDEGR